jgi:hypothetical protein
MEPKVSVWKANLTSGVIMGVVGIVYTLVMYFLDLTLNKSMGYIFIALSIFLLYYFIKAYRDNHLHGYITYGQAVGAGVIVYLYYAIISAVFMYILYTFIDPELPKKMLAMIEEQLTKGGRIPAEQMDAVMAFQKKIMIPEIQAPMGVFFNMIFGTIISLIVSVFIKKEGNPLLMDEPEKL